MDMLIIFIFKKEEMVIINKNIIIYKRKDLILKKLNEYLCIKYLNNHLKCLHPHSFI